jgi:hypothetical protein
MSTAEITIHHGDTEVFPFTITDVDGAAVDLTAEDGITASFAYRPLGDVLFSKTIGDGIALGDDQGTATLTINAADLVDVPNAWGTLLGDIRVDGDDGPATPISVQLRIIPSIGEAES